MAESRKNLDRLIKELKSGLLQKDARIEELELSYRQLRAETERLRGQIALNPGEVPSDKKQPGADWQDIDVHTSQQARADANTVEDAVGWPPLPLRGGCKAVQVSRAFGFYVDKWSGPEVHAKFRAVDRIHKGAVRVWTAPGARDLISLTLHINNNCVGVYSVATGKATTLSFEAGIPGDEVFTIKMVSDFSERASPPDVRLLAFVLMEVDFF